MNDEKIYCVCSKCRKVFDFNDARIVDRLLYTFIIKEKTCPYCGSYGCTRIKDLKWFEKYYIQPKIN